MSRVFAWFVLILALVMILVGITHLETARPAALLFWLVVGGYSAWRLFGKKAPKSG